MPVTSPSALIWVRIVSAGETCNITSSFFFWSATYYCLKKGGLNQYLRCTCEWVTTKKNFFVVFFFNVWTNCVEFSLRKNSRLQLLVHPCCCCCCCYRDGISPSAVKTLPLILRHLTRVILIPPTKLWPGYYFPGKCDCQEFPTRQQASVGENCDLVSGSRRYKQRQEG